MYFTILLVVHVLGAIAGLGPTFTFAVLGPMAGKARPGGGLAILEAMDTIVWKIVTPVALVAQPLTGVLLIFETDRDNNFFQQEWLVVSIVAYAIILYLSYFQSNPALRKMISMAKAGRAGTPEFGALAKRSAVRGPIMTMLLALIIVLMVWKPGDGPF